MARKVVDRLVAERRQYYKHMVLSTSLTKVNILGDVKNKTAKRVQSKQISFRGEAGATVDDGGTVANLFNKFFATIAGKKREQCDQTWRKFNFSSAVKSMFPFLVGDEEEEKIKNALNLNKSNGIDGISVETLKSKLPMIWPQ